MNKTAQRKIAVLKNKIERATQKPDPTGQIIAGLKSEIVQLEMGDGHVYCAVHEVQLRAHPYYQGQGIHCAACAALHKRADDDR